MKLQVYAFVHNHSGPAMHAREFTKALAAVGADVSLKSHFQHSSNWITEPELQPLLDKPAYEKDITIILEDPASWWYHMPERREALIGSLVIEGTCAPYGWAHAAAQKSMTQIWVPSNHTKAAVFEAFDRFGFPGAKEKVFVIPHGYNPIYFHRQGRKHKFGHFDDYFTFLFVGGWSQGTRDRKGLDILYQAFLEEFAEDEPVRLVAKITNVYNSAGYNPVEELKKVHNGEGRGQVLLIGQDFASLDDLAALYRAGDVLVIPSKAEGFHMPGLEALACGTPVLSTTFGGQMDYLTPANSWLLQKGELIPATDANKPLYDWSLWRKPNVQELREALRFLYENRAEVEKKKEQAYESIKDWTWENAARKAIAAIESLNKPKSQ